MSQGKPIGAARMVFGRQYQPMAASAQQISPMPTVHSQRKGAEAHGKPWASTKATTLSARTKGSCRHTSKN